VEVDPDLSINGDHAINGKHMVMVMRAPDPMRGVGFVRCKDNDVLCIDNAYVGRYCVYTTIDDHPTLR
jgi:hypothetical protein